MNKTLIYPVNAVFPSREALNKFVERRKLIEGKYLVAEAILPSIALLLFYNPSSREIELELKGNTIDEMVNAEKEFFRIVENLFRKVY